MEPAELLIREAVEELMASRRSEVSRLKEENAEVEKNLVHAQRFLGEQVRQLQSILDLEEVADTIGKKFIK